MSFRVVNGKLTSVEPIGTLNKDINKNINKNTNEKIEFKDILEKEINKNNSFNISKHAQQRLKDRNIILDDEDMKAINDGLNLAQKKGSQDSLILYKDVAFVASVKNRTIITAVEKNNEDNVFTNIDSVVLI